jgi:2-keto-3-deoxy-galactonokinase
LKNRAEQKTWKVGVVVALGMVGGDGGHKSYPMPAMSDNIARGWVRPS